MKQKQATSRNAHSPRRFALITLVTLLVTAPLAALLLYLVATTYHFLSMDSEHKTVDTSTQIHTTATPPFPLGVDPLKKTITEQSGVETYLIPNGIDNTEQEKRRKTSFLRKAIARLALFEWYQNLAAGGSRILVIQPGERREQIASNFGKILGWSDVEDREFLANIVSADPVLLEGKFIPGSYIVTHGADPYVVASLVTDRFYTEVLSRYPSNIEAQVPLSDTLIIASLLEREAYDFEDMRYIAGVIWNRLFIDMNLQIDATLQYAKVEHSTKSWWPNPTPADKYIDSPYNTYQNKGLPPTPIANPSLEAILAALNPRVTDCYYYFHDSDGGFHCTATYKEHVALLKQFFGRGK